MFTRITLPTVDSMVLDHHEQANAAIEAMSPSRSYGAETNLSSWRRHLSVVNYSAAIWMRRWRQSG